ncbi:MAG TPA: hypothetical protein VIW92_05090 [Thermoanaerobaculia bacterium]
MTEDFGNRLAREDGMVRCLKDRGWEEWFPYLLEFLDRVAQSPVSDIRELLDELERCRCELGISLCERREIALNWLWSTALAYLRLDFQEGDAHRAAAIQAYQASVVR